MIAAGVVALVCVPVAGVALAGFRCIIHIGKPMARQRSNAITASDSGAKAYFCPPAFGKRFAAVLAKLRPLAGPGFFFDFLSSTLEALADLAASAAAFARATSAAFAAAAAAASAAARCCCCCCCCWLLLLLAIFAFFSALLLTGFSTGLAAVPRLRFGRSTGVMTTVA